ncbi:ribonuclease T [Kaistia algarum]|uniref:ribonuclease T2 family protein n=1 Tax=Kaistia algarum TaxID=2083279 RepID=UPI000CE9175A|nr:ribonuclease T [Kaistia algarum]MCX5511924.1 ribonuclease T [Kaistia algarum]PPE80057.1 ribonuclease T [Kaistia algarum]
MRGRFHPTALLATLILLFGLAPDWARADNPGDFAFYVLSLSWSPTYCESSQGRSDRIQCGGRPFSFVVHGLWPQYERGYPSDCPSAGPMGVSGSIIDAMLDIMPSPGLIRHEWRTHGTCSGLPQRAYFDLIRRASEIVRIPERFTDNQEAVTVSPREVEAAFRAANPGLPGDGIGVACDSRRLKEVRICLTRDLSFRSCPEVDRAACRRDRLVMPPVR